MIFPKQRYQCIQCGKSCGEWRIWVEPELVGRVRQLALRLQVADQPYLVEHENGWHHLRHDQNGRCFFLQQERLCGLHAEAGWLSKPRACRQFPFFLTQTPDGCQVGLSFRCSAVQQNLGVDWVEHGADLDQLVSSGSYPRVGFEPVPFGCRQLNWPTYSGWEASWRGQTRPLLDRFYEHLVEHLALGLERYDFARLVRSWTVSALGLLQISLELANVHYDQESARYFDHVLERKWLWLGENFLGRMLVLLVGEQLYWSARAAGLNALDLVEGEWLGHREDLGPVEHGLASTLLQFCQALE